MSTERLREAAALMRSRAEAASQWTPARWFAADGAVLGGMASPHQVVAPITTYDGDGEHIASWHPAVALAVAMLLDNAAQDMEMQSPTGELREHWDMRVNIACKHAIAVADAYLGATS